jgi:hypothetical protein
VTLETAIFAITYVFATLAGHPLRHPKTKAKTRSSANAKTLADATVESHPRAKIAQGWGTRRARKACQKANTFVFQWCLG